MKGGVAVLYFCKKCHALAAKKVSVNMKACAGAQAMNPLVHTIIVQHVTTRTLFEMCFCPECFELGIHFEHWLAVLHRSWPSTCAASDARVCCCVTTISFYGLHTASAWNTCTPQVFQWSWPFFQSSYDAEVPCSSTIGIFRYHTPSAWNTALGLHIECSFSPSYSEVASGESCFKLFLVFFKMGEDSSLLHVLFSGRCNRFLFEY